MNEDALQQFTSGLRGKAFTPASEGYDEARTVWNGTIDKHPAIIVRCGGVADVMAAVRFARDEGLGVSIRGGGHHVAGGALLDGGLVIDLSQLRGVHVDPSNNTVRVEGGAQIADVDHEAQAFGLAVPMGLFSETGIAGYTLAGGLGWLRRKVGMTCDSLIAAEVVTADGRLVKASASENPDLYWALRGGGWDMGVVTSFEYQAYPVGPEVFFIFVAYPIEEAKQTMQRFRDYCATAPDEASPIGIIWTFGEHPYPEHVWNKQFFGVAGIWCGDPDEGERLLQPLRELGEPMLDMSDRIPYLAVQHLFDEEYPKGRRYYWKSSYLGGLSDGAIDTLLKIGAGRPSQLTSVDIWALGGAIARVSPDETPISHRNAAYLIGLEANWDGADGDAANIAWGKDAAQELLPFSTGGSYLNFEDLSESGAVARSHGANLERLIAVKKQYDPDNLFRSRRGLVD